MNKSQGVNSFAPRYLNNYNVFHLRDTDQEPNIVENFDKISKIDPKNLLAAYNQGVYYKQKVCRV